MGGKNSFVEYHGGSSATLLLRISNMAFFREHHKWKYWRETNSDLLKISKQIQQVWLWEDRKGKDVHPDRNVEK